MAKGNNAAPVIIKKVKKVAGGGHHGGAWKVAYADFVTAMMAFFLLLWLLNVTTDVQKRGIADYFDPSIASRSISGAGGVLGGISMGPVGAQSTPSSRPNLSPAIESMRQPADGEDGTNNGAPAKTERDDATDADQAPAPAREKPIDQITEAEVQKKLAATEEKQFAAAEFALRQAIQDVPELKNLADNLIIDRTPEGLRIQIVDQDKRSMFPLGSAQMDESAQKLLALVAQVVQKLPNKISITGHTDATPYAFGRNYGNWELSADRANASRRELLNDGVPIDRIDKVVGMADRDLLDPRDPRDPRNRRISIVLLHQALTPPPSSAAQPTPPASSSNG
ncbi:MAG TPA: flagellar motor protein MotB [Stellaceae bacterium]|nr:flagellar motor protein MotB [Stellaceae bacterium]